MENDYGYTLVLTHDLDLLSIRELPWSSRLLWGIVYRGLLLNPWRALRGRCAYRVVLAGIKLVATVPLIKLGFLPDPFDSATRSMIELEQRLGVRSTLYVIPLPNQAGHDDTGRPAPRSRACYYRAAAYTQWLRDLDREGWEIGVHGLDAHLDHEAAREELQAIERLLGHDGLGVRMHWLYHRGEKTYQVLSDTGYAYDASAGSNVEVGWPGGKREPWRSSNGLWVLPLNVQDATLLGDRALDLTEKQARARIESLLAEAKADRAVLTILWHNHSFAPPRCWGGLYEWTIRHALADHARVMTAGQLVKEYRRG
jgi:hypothetical protein